MRRLIPFLIGFAFIMQAAAQPPRLTVFAAASLSEAMKAIDQAWVAKDLPHSACRSRPARRSRASSITVLVQHLCLADDAWVNWAIDRHLIDAASRRDVVSTQLVLIVPKEKEHPQEIDLKPGFDLVALLGKSGRLAVGDPAHVPAGRYAKQALTSLGVWGIASKHLAPAENVRSALLLVERGEVPAGIVYATDAAASSRVVVVGTFPPNSHDPINYPFAITRAGDTPEARSLLDFIAGPEGQTIFARFGFITE